MKLYLLRHGQTDLNAKKLMQGTLDIPLNDNGKKQALEVKKEIDEINIDLIITSPLIRALETAKIIGKGRNIEIFFDKRIIERDLGKLSGKDKSLYDVDLYWNLDKNYTDENGVEPIQDLLNRVSSFLEDIKFRYKDKNILIVSHSATIKAIIKCISGDMKNISNCELIEYEI